GKMSLSEMSDLDEVIPKPKSRAARPVTKKPSKVVESDTDDEAEFKTSSKPSAADESDFDEVLPKPKARATKPAAKPAAKKAAKKAAKSSKAKNDSDDEVVPKAAPK